MIKKEFSRKPKEKTKSRFGQSEGFRSSGGPRFFQKKVCKFCGDHTLAVNYKETEKLARFITEKGKIIPARITGNCAKHQRLLARAVKRSRHAALLPFQAES